MPIPNEPVWCVPVRWGLGTREFWFTASELAKAKQPEGPGTPPAADYKMELHCFQGTFPAFEKITLRGAWIHEPGGIICDEVVLEG